MSIENPETWWLVVRVVPLIAAFLVFARALLAARRDSALGFAHLAAQHEQALAETRRVSATLVELTAQVRELSLPSPIVSQRLAPVPPPAPPAPMHNPPVRGYEMAIRMARGGASIEDIVGSCGTTRAEARLLCRLHRASDASAA